MKLAIAIFVAMSCTLPLPAAQQAAAQQSQTIQMQCRDIPSGGGYVAPDETIINGKACREVSSSSKPPVVSSQALAEEPKVPTTPTSLKAVKKIYVGSMGQSDEAERFRLLLGGELSKVGFVSTDNSEDADAILTGALSVRVYADESVARATIVLSDRDGHKLWAKDFEPRFKLGGAKDTVKFRAENVAKDLHKECEKASR